MALLAFLFFYVFARGAFSTKPRHLVHRIPIFLVLCVWSWYVHLSLFDCFVHMYVYVYYRCPVWVTCAAYKDDIRERDYIDLDFGTSGQLFLAVVLTAIGGAITLGTRVHTARHPFIHPSPS